MEELVVSIKGYKGTQEAEIRTSGEVIYLCSNGKNLMISPGELYDLINLFMSPHYENFG